MGNPHSIRHRRRWRGKAVAAVERYLRRVAHRRGIYDYAVVCDEPNNSIAAYVREFPPVQVIKLSATLKPTGATFVETIDGKPQQ